MRTIYELEYTHLPVDEDVTCVAGHYTPHKEVKLKYDGREVLYVVGQAVIESSCCGTGCWGYVLVPGYITDWQKRTSDTGYPITVVEPISDKAVKADLRCIISEAESISQVDFW